MIAENGFLIGALKSELNMTMQSNTKESNMASGVESKLYFYKDNKPLLIVSRNFPFSRLSVDAESFHIISKR